MKLVSRSVLLGLVALSTLSYSSDLYFLCGPDEDRCIEGSYQHCFCIPYNDTEANEPYCLNFDEMNCTPVSQTPLCKSHFRFKNQGECLATLFQSQPIPSCTITNHAFCLQEHTYRCDPDGQLSSCHKFD